MIWYKIRCIRTKCTGYSLYLDQAIKNSLVADGGTGFTFPPCSAPAYVSGTNYVGGSKVSFDGSVGSSLSFRTANLNPLHSSSLLVTSGRPISLLRAPLRVSQGGRGARVSSTLFALMNLLSHVKYLVSACSGSAASAPSTSTSQSSSTPSSSSSSPSTSSTSAPASGNCAGVAAWSNSVPYNGGSQVTSGE